MTFDEAVKKCQKVFSRYKKVYSRCHKYIGPWEICSYGGVIRKSATGAVVAHLEIQKVSGHWVIDGGYVLGHWVVDGGYMDARTEMWKRLPSGMDGIGSMREIVDSCLTKCGYILNE